MNFLTHLSDLFSLFFPPLFPEPHAPRKKLLLPATSPVQATAISSVAMLQLPTLKETKSPKKIQCSVIPTLHCADTQEWRKHLILSAQHNIVISGNYCGGKAFDEILELIGQRMTDVSELQVLLISHPGFTTDKGCQNRKNLRNLAKKFPKRFYLVESPDIYCESKKTTNHAKFTLIDFGKYYILGGSGIKDNFALTGLDDLTVEQYLQLEKEAQSQKGKEKKLLSESPTLDKKKHALIPGNFRDQDFIFHSPCNGKKMYRQALFLAYKWDRYKKDGEQGLTSESWELNDLKSIKYPALRDLSFATLPKIQANECVLYRMLKRPIPDLEFIKTKVPVFKASLRKVKHVEAQLFFTGPETSYANPFTQAMLARVRAAVREIIIDHVYFQPPKELTQELIAAVKRGVKLTVITAGLTKNCPDGQKIWGPKNIAHYTYLLEKLENEEHLKIYEFEQNKKGLHKKVVIIDDYILAGSANMDHKCLVLMGDHETSFIAKSQKLVDQTMPIIQEDIKHSRLVQRSSLQVEEIKA